MRGTMMDFPLTLPTILERAGKVFPRVEIISRKPDKSIARQCFGDFYPRARRLAAALTNLGLKPGDRVASMMWNHAGHLEAFFGVPCAGGILHTLNLRLHPHEIAGIAKHAGDAFPYTEIDETDGAAMCFTSGTTGCSKRVIYSPPPLVLPSFAPALP